MAHFQDPNGTVGRITDELNQLFALDSLTIRLRIENMQSVKFIRNQTFASTTSSANLYKLTRIINQQSTWQEANVYVLLSYNDQSDDTLGRAWVGTICDTRRGSRSLMADYDKNDRRTAEASHEH